MKQDDNSREKLLERFRNGREFTEELLNENELLRVTVAKLKAEKLERDIASRNGDISLLRDKIRILEKELEVQLEENRAMHQQFVEMEEINRDFAERYVAVEGQNSDLVSLYVASLQLHSTLDYREVITVLKDLVINMVGSEEFAIYLKDPEDNRPRLIASVGFEGDRLAALALGEARTGHTLSTGQMYVHKLEAGQRRDNSGEPIACIPLMVQGDVFGAVTIYSLLLQKDGFKPLDFELFDLFGNHASTALYSSKLYALQGSTGNHLDEFIQLIEDMPKAPALDNPLTPKA